ncbi:CDP-alcohol phosphatidyltransferase family protein [Hymenobacter caeli]|uniref:CDP-diacylglycerol--glycerol-3-phosphate 3-phosphatidyltransferase n=1 Tax=Hymenobacter caeli TaxID=2735894 RepID=A0ABX2FSV7_9BACT|nr:CDP-alcohol phosphatidyltransferase family protein [Hymenobacter caeli]NRT20281.1 CDP-diacylglycerol--glycerol-3-phosphate 3-phosphatidyltransferase [Hymenobacter caeli]
MKHAPVILIYSRLVIGSLLVFLSWLKLESFPIVAIVLISIGLLTDVFDGIIARQLKVSTEKLRRLDSTVDQIFWLLVVGAVYLECQSFFELNALKLLVLLALEVATYAICFIKFRKEIATHSWGAKLWVLISFATLIQIITTCKSGVLFNICFCIGVVSRIEIIVIILILKGWVNDVPTFYHALLLRKNKPIKRHKLFNG